MSDFSFKSWETMNFEDIILGGGVDVYFLILDHPLASTYTDPSQDLDIMYSGFKPADTLYMNMENILVSRATLQDMAADYYPLTFGEDRIFTFYIYETGNNWTEYDTAADWTAEQCITVDVEFDWSYINNLPYMSELSDPIEYKIDPRQYITWTCRQIVPGTPNDITVNLDGVSEPVFWMSMVQRKHQYTLHLLASDFVGSTPGTIVLINNLTRLELIQSCSEYCLYYQNRLGGWDWLLVNGTTTQKDKISRLYYKKQYEAQNQGSYNKVNYVSTINESWELNTSWLSDEQSSKMPALLESTKIMMHNLTTNEMIPVFVTNSTAECKTYKNQGRKLYSYKIEVEASKPKFRT